MLGAGSARLARFCAIACASLLLTTLACTRAGELIPLSENLRRNYQLADPELRKLQYYISHQIVLERAIPPGARVVQRGRLVVRGGHRLNQVTIPAGTPGWVEATGFVGDTERAHVLEVSFEKGAPLRFTPWEPGGAYVMEGKQRPASFSALFFGGGRRKLDVEFDGTTWHVAAGSAAHLLIQRNALAKLERTNRVLKGVRGPGTR